MGKTTAFLDRRLKQFKHLFETESNENPTDILVKFRILGTIF